ncbi:hypothetical protein N7539_007764 [Penicillium diatomitis]|uniref:Uncharacterized protein n=1 Tax=Penicillium diatomitis TaxID=2819901 RepID=A0A9W9WUS8_9EURO|nr:uncharacterized protein N7539_007764 [Penicillium diatomitis]KAJ5475477.1 hypothetical protein N7539_007764 [Penicillium diatomitis]
MKSFAISAAILASVAAALPASVVSNVASGVLSTPSYTSSGVPVISNLPSSVNVATEGYSAQASAGAAQVSTGQIPSQASGLVDGKVNNVLGVTDQAGKLVKVVLEPTVANLLAGLNLGGVVQSVGQIVQVAPTLHELNLDGVTGTTLTVATGTGGVALVKVNSLVEGLLSGLGLGQTGSLVGSIVGNVEGVVSGAGSTAKRDGLPSKVMTITNLHGLPLHIQLNQSILNLLGGLDLSSVQGVVGTVVAEVPVVSQLAGAAQNVDADQNQLFGVLGQDGVSALLVKVEGTVTGLLSMLGLSSLTTTVGSVVPAGLL